MNNESYCVFLFTLESTTRIFTIAVVARVDVYIDIVAYISRKFVVIGWCGRSHDYPTDIHTDHLYTWRYICFLIHILLFKSETKKSLLFYYFLTFYYIYTLRQGIEIGAHINAVDRIDSL